MTTPNKNIILQTVNNTKEIIDRFTEKQILDKKKSKYLIEKLSDISISLTTPLIVTVIGAFSSGKTAFINAIIGEQLLPEKMTPCTGMICRINYCNSNLKIQYLQNGRRIIKEINVHELNRYIDISDEAYISREAEDVLDIFHNNDFCEKGIILVDTPGFNDPNFQDEKANEALKHSDAIIYCMSAIQAYSRMDAEKIKELQQNGNAIFFVIGYMDILYLNDKNKGTNEMETFKINKIKQLSPITELHEEGVFFISATEKLNHIANRKCIMEDDGIDTVRGKLLDYLQQNRHSMKLTNAYNKLVSIHDVINQDTYQKLQHKTKCIHTYKKEREILQQNKFEAQRYQSRIPEVCSKYENEIYNFTKMQIEVEIMSICDNLENWIDEVFEKNSISAWETFKLAKDDMQKKIMNQLQEKCVEKLQNAVSSRILPYINASREKLQSEINYAAEKYITSLQINKQRAIPSPRFAIDINENTLFPQLSPITVVTQAILIWQPTLLLIANIFNPLRILILGISFFQHKKKKQQIATKIKEKLRSYSFIHAYVQVIMDSIHWREEITPIPTQLEAIIQKYEIEIAELEALIESTRSEINEIEHTIQEQSQIFTSMQSL